MANNSLNNARAAKKDEFYTQFYGLTRKTLCLPKDH